jgi:hypothetical protein
LREGYGPDFANEYFGCSDLANFDLMLLQKSEFFTWADNSTWGSRLAGGLNYAIDFNLKKFVLTSSYTPDTLTLFGEGLIPNDKENP